MALKTFKPITPSLRQLVIVDRSELYKGKPLKSLTEGMSSAGGRNNTGRITVRFRGGGHKQTYRIVDFKRRKVDSRPRWNGSNTIRTGPRSSRWSRYADGEPNYIVAPQRLRLVTRSCRATRWT